METETKQNQLTIVQQGLEKFTSLKEELVEMKTKSSALVFTSMDDKERINDIVETRKTLKQKRVEIEKAGKLLRDQINPVIKEILSKEKELIAVIKPEEERLLEIEKAIEADKEAKRKEKERLEMEVVQNRINQLLEFGHVADFFTVKSWSDEQFEHELKTIKQEFEQEEARKETERLHAEELERIRLEQEASERAEMERIKAEQQKVYEEQEHVRMEQETIKKAQEAEVRKIQEMKDELEREKERTRLQKLELIAKERKQILHQFWSEEHVGVIEFLGSMSDDEFMKIQDQALKEYSEEKERKKLDEEYRIKQAVDMSEYIDKADNRIQEINFNKPVEATLFPETKNEKESFEVLAKAVERFPATDEHEEKNLMKDDASLLLEELEFMINEFPMLDAIKIKVSTLKKIKTCLENFMFSLNANK